MSCLAPRRAPSICARKSGYWLRHRRNVRGLTSRNPAMSASDQPDLAKLHAREARSSLKRLLPCTGRLPAISVRIEGTDFSLNRALAMVGGEFSHSHAVSRTLLERLTFNYIPWGSFARRAQCCAVFAGPAGNTGFVMSPWGSFELSGILLKNRAMAPIPCRLSLSFSCPRPGAQATVKFTPSVQVYVGELAGRSGPCFGSAGQTGEGCWQRRPRGAGRHSRSEGARPRVRALPLVP